MCVTSVKMDAFGFLLFVAFISMNAVNVSGVYTMPKECVGQTYCTVPGDNYPSDEELEDVVRDVIELPGDEEYRIGLRISERLHMSCRANYTNATIYYIVDKNNLTLPVVQLNNYFMQTYELRYCKNEDFKNCDNGALNGLNAKPVCETQHMYFDFFVVNSDGNLQLSEALIPVCCKCTYKRS